MSDKLIDCVFAEAVVNGSIGSEGVPWARPPRFGAEIELFMMQYKMTLQDYVINEASDLQRRLIIRSLLVAYTKLWHNGFVHCDVKPDNIGVTVVPYDDKTPADAYVHIGDLLTTIYAPPNGIVTENTTYTAEFCAPERLVAALRGVPCNVSYLSDVFSLGLVIARICCPKMMPIPRTAEGDDRRISALNAYFSQVCDLQFCATESPLRDSIVSLGIEIPVIRRNVMDHGKYPEMTSLVVEMLRFDPAKRATLSTILQNPIMADYFAPQRELSQTIHVRDHALIADVAAAAGEFVENVDLVTFIAHYMFSRDMKMLKASPIDLSLQSVCGRPLPATSSIRMTDMEAAWVSFIYAADTLSNRIILNIRNSRITCPISLERLSSLCCSLTVDVNVYPIRCSITREALIKANAAILENPQLLELEPHNLLERFF